MAMHGSATPGLYASVRSRWVATAFVGTTSIFPGRPSAWYSSASLSNVDNDLSPVI